MLYQAKPMLLGVIKRACIFDWKKAESNNSACSASKVATVIEQMPQNGRHVKESRLTCCCL